VWASPRVRGAELQQRIGADTWGPVGSGRAGGGDLSMLVLVDWLLPAARRPRSHLPVSEDVDPAGDPLRSPKSISVLCGCVFVR